MNRLFLFLAIFSMAIVATAQTTVAKIGDTEYSDLQTAADALKYGEVLTLVADVTLEDDACIEFKNSGGGTYTLDLNGHNVTGKTKDDGLFYSKTVLTITGEGKVENTGDKSDAFSAANGGTIIINGGTYKSVADVCYQNDTEAKIIINDGRFAAPNFYYEKMGHKGITVKGGLFNCDKKSLTDCVAEGYEVVDNTDEATKTAYPYAVKQIVAKIGDTEYTDLKTAAYDLKDGDVLKLVADVTLADNVCIEFKNSGSYTIDLNGHNVTGKTKDDGLFGSKTVLTITGEGNVENTGDRSDAFAAANGGTVIINGGTYKSGADLCYVNDDKSYITINDGRFTAPKFYNEKMGHKGITVKGGLFNCDKDNLSACVAEGYEVVDNTDEATKDDYPYAVKKVFTTPTGVETIGAGKAGKVIKTIENGEIVIIRDGVKYDLSGAKLR